MPRCHRLSQAVLHIQTKVPGPFTSWDILKCPNRSHLRHCPESQVPNVLGYSETSLDILTDPTKDIAQSPMPKCPGMSPPRTLPRVPGPKCPGMSPPTTLPRVQGPKCPGMSPPRTLLRVPGPKCPGMSPGHPGMS